MRVLECIREHARRCPGHPAIICDSGKGGPEVVTYAELITAMDAHAENFRAAGARAGDRCGLVARQGPGFVEAALGLMAADLCMVPIPDDAGPDAVGRLCAEAHLHALVDESRGFRFERFEDVEPADGQGDRAFRALQPAYLRFTSGTTHERKGVVLSQESIAARIEAANRGLRIQDSDRIMWLLPMAHHFVVSVLLYLRFGATLLVPRSSLAASVLELAETEGATLCYASPYHFTLLGEDTSSRRLDDLRLAISTAAGLRTQVAERFRSRFGKPLVQALGIIEVGLPVMNLTHAEEAPEALGTPLPDYEVWLQDESGGRVAKERYGSADASGEICIDGPGLFDAYLSPFIPSDEAIAQAGFRTGDQGWFDSNGLLHLTGRRHNRISMAGMKFFAEEVEAVLARHSGVSLSRVRGEAHDRLGEFPVAEIVVRPSSDVPSEKELSAHCRSHLPGYQVPRRFEIVEAIPLTATGKVQRWGP